MKKKVGTRSLTLEEVLVIRRKLGGMANVEIARDLNRTPAWVNARLQTARIRWGTSGQAEFLAMPEVLEAIKEDP